MAEYNKPLPKVTPLTKGFWDFANQRKLAMQVCDACAHVHFPPSPVCPKCLSDQQHWQPVSGRARLESLVEFHRAYWTGFEPDLPYKVCLVRLEEGPILLSNLVGDEAKIGDSVHAVFEETTAAFTLPKFTKS